MIDWKKIQTVLLDMDGTLLDLHFDDYFWREHVPQRYAEKYSIEPEQAKSELLERYRSFEGSLEWYCLDFWSKELGLDIPVLKQEVEHLIAVQPHVVEFLDAVRQRGIRAVLVTNAHGKSLSLKMEKTRLGGHLDALVCSHDLGLPKEDPAFWNRLNAVEPFDPAHTVLVDDSLPVLESARTFGIHYLIAILQPDRKRPMRLIEGFDAIDTFDEIFPD
ncbi:MAG: GMP/IMP nucleotidase [Acidobacteriota bacterium]|nr:MAG: GMP/IMP nucleotidase [Acidobacteriota bacterium]